LASLSLPPACDTTSTNGTRPPFCTTLTRKPREVLGMEARQGVMLTSAGVLFGLVLAFASMRAVAGFLVNISPFDLLTFAAASLFLAAVALIASLSLRIAPPASGRRMRSEPSRRRQPR
jgi:hypothetical protein